MKDTHCQEVPKILREHRELLDLADDVLEITAGGANCDIKKAYITLNDFGDKLRSHIEYENKIFYGKLLQDMWDDGENTTDVEKFISDMKRISDVVFDFLERYDAPDKIKADTSRFGKDFGKIVGILILRIESEETSKYVTNC